MKTWIKICGNTNLVDALAAAEAGADAVGFLFSDSPRRIDAEAAQLIVEELPPDLEKIGVFVNESAEFVLNVACEVGLTGVQLHGEESPGYVKTLLALAPPTELKVIKSVPAEVGQFKGLGPFTGGEELVDALMVDSGSAAMRGGTGRVFDWLRASDFIMGLKEKLPVVIAGGLNAANVSAAVCMFAPFGVDVVTGVEKAPGHKDHQKLRMFISTVRNAERQGSERMQ